MAYNAITAAACVPASGSGPFTDCYYALAFPAAGRRAVLDLYRHGKKRPELINQVPVRRLNAALRAVAPDLVSVADNAAVDDGRPWLYAKREYPLHVLNALIASWLYTMQPSPEAFPLVMDTMRQLDVKSLSWDLMAVNLTEQTVSEGGTAIPAPHLYRLLPDVLAARIERLDPYEYCGTRVEFKRVATEQGAELISWPPSEYRPKPKKGQAARPWRFSGVIKLTLQTVPFSPVPRIHIATGIRRWVRDSVWVPENQGVSVYLRSDAPWLAGAEESARFAVAKLRWSKREHAPAWAVGGPQGILARLSTASEFPPPKSLAEEPDTWIDGRDGVTAAVTYHTANGYHGVGAGLGPSERRRLTEWAAQALAPEFQPLGELTRSGRKPVAPRRVLTPPEPMPKKDPTPDKVAKAEAANAVIDAANAERRRERLACAVGGDRVFSCHLLYQTDTVRDALVSAAERNLGLDEYRVAGSAADTWVWRAPEVEVRLRALPLGELGSPLGGAVAPKRGEEHQEAVARRRTATKELLMSLGEFSQLVFVELEGRSAFGALTDPKGAIRVGCAEAGRVSQFITPEKQLPGDDADADDAPDDEVEGTFEHRANAAWADGLRQAGMSFVPQHTLGDAVPGKLNQLAFWIVRRNTSESSWRQQFTPVAVLIRPDQDTIMGRTPGTQGWVPYAQLLKDLTGQVRGPDLKTADQQQAETARFVRQMLYTVRSEPTVVFTHAQNARSRWDWLLNGQLAADKIRVGGGPVQDLALHGKQVTLIRVRDGDRDETAQWWAPDTEEIAGWSQGLWVPPDASEGSRVFYATTEKPGSHQKKKRDDTKLTPHVHAATGKLVTNWTRNAWNPVLLEIAVVGHAPGADPEAWAMYVQQQRFADDYRDALKFPLALHLAELAREYALPYGDEIEEITTFDESDDSITLGDLDDSE
jgi:hypothetical protein